MVIGHHAGRSEADNVIETHKHAASSKNPSVDFSLLGTPGENRSLIPVAHFVPLLEFGHYGEAEAYGGGCACAATEK